MIVIKKYQEYSLINFLAIKDKFIVINALIGICHIFLMDLMLYNKKM